MKSNQNLDADGRPYNRGLLIASLLIGGFLTVLTETILNNGLADIARSLSITTATAQWLSTGYMLTMGIMVPVSAFLLNRFNSRNLYLVALVIFIIGTSIAFVASNFPILLIGRLIQAASVGIIMPFMRNIMLLIFPVEKRGLAMGLTGIVIALAPAFGPTLSGWIVMHYSWHYIFGALLPVSVLVLILAFFGMRKILKTSNPELDIRSVAYSTVGFGGILYGFSTVAVGDKLISGAAILIGLIGVLLLILRQKGLTTPMLDMSVFRSFTFTLTTVLTSLASMALLGLQLLLPLYLQDAFHIPALTVGLIMLPGALVMGAITPISGLLFDKFGIKLLSIIGFGVYTGALIAFALMGPNTSTFAMTVTYMVWMGGISLMLMQLVTAGVNDLSMDKIPDGNAINSMGQQVFASFSTAASISLITLVAAGNPQLSNSAATLLGYHYAFYFLIFTGAIGLVGSFFLKK